MGRGVGGGSGEGRGGEGGVGRGGRGGEGRGGQQRPRVSLSFFPDTYNSIQTSLIPSLSMPRFYLAADLLSHGWEIKSEHGKAGLMQTTSFIVVLYTM